MPSPLMQEMIRLIRAAQVAEPGAWQLALAEEGADLQPAQTWARLSNLAQARLTLTVLGESTTALLCPACGQMIRLRRGILSITCECGWVQVRRRGI